jgi:hypothetical protein
MALGSTQPVTEMSDRNISWGKGGWCVRLTTLPPSCSNCLEIWEPHSPGTLWACPELYRECFTFYLILGYRQTEGRLPNKSFVLAFVRNAQELK